MMLAKKTLDRNWLKKYQIEDFKRLGSVESLMRNVVA